MSRCRLIFPEPAAPAVNGPFLGMDIGGTSSKAVVISGGRVVGEGQAGPGNIDEVPLAVVRESIRDAVVEAAASARVAPHDFEAVVLGVAGVASQADRDLVSEAVAPLSLAQQTRIVIVHDCRVALAGALSGRPGLVIIAGTGSACYGWRADGEDWLAGHWGSLVGDEGGSYRVGVAGIRAITRAVDGRGPQTALTEPIMRQLQIQDLEQLNYRLHVIGVSHRDLAGLAVEVASAARGGDEVARQIFHSAARELAEAACAVSRRLRFPSTVEIATVGGLFTDPEVLGVPLADAVAEKLPGARLVSAEMSPAQGAAFLAMGLAQANR